MQKRYTLLNQEKDKVEADKMKLEQSYKAKIVELEQQLSETSSELSMYNKELLQAQEDISLVCIIWIYKIIGPLTLMVGLGGFSVF